MPKSKYFINKLSTFYIFYVVSQVSDLLPLSLIPPEEQVREPSVRSGPPVALVYPNTVTILI